MRPPEQPFVSLLFLDGVGLGDDDPQTNPFVTAVLPNLNNLLGQNWFLRHTGPITTPRASFIPTDASLGVPGRPQSATGQAVILSGRNIPQAIGEHYGPKPNTAVRNELAHGTLFDEVLAAGKSAALLTPYPQPYFDAIKRGRRLYSAVPQAAVNAGLSLRTADDLRQGQAISPDFTNQGWVDMLGYTDIPVYDMTTAGQKLAALSAQFDFSFFEHWPSDRPGHRGPLSDARAHLEMLDHAIGALLNAWPDDSGLLLITSDHGNIEDKSQRQHTKNPVPTILVGPNHAELAAQISTLLDIAPVVRQALGLQPPATTT
jgi:2,3-bisphosphoglycerate-independent phosphoglycerate mutase